MNIIKNYIYNTIYQIMVLLAPLITIPYLTRIFTPEQIGVNSYTLSIVNYFTLFGLLGMQMYGNRKIAYVRDDKTKLTKTFWSLYCTQFITSSISLVIYLLFVMFCVTNYKIIYYIQGLNILSVIIDISWLFMGLEDFKKISIRNLAIKILGIAGIFIFVKSSDDLILLIFISAIINIFGVLVMWLYVPKYVGRITVSFEIIKRTRIPLLMLFLPQIASQVYMLLARTMIGVLSTIDQVAYYDYSQKIIRMVLALITSIGTVLMPRISYMTSKGQKKEIIKFVEKVFYMVSYISMPMAIGLMSISNNMVSWFLGSQYRETGNLIALSATIIIAVSWANIIGIQYLVATNQENKYTLSVIVAAIISFILNLILLKEYGAYGAIISLIVAEFGGVILQMIAVRKKLPVRRMLINSSKYLIVSCVMGFVIGQIGTAINNKFIATVIQVITGIGIYITIMSLIKDKIQKEIIDKIMKLRKRNSVSSDKIII